mgnify:CR=1 FL=1
MGRGTKRKRSETSSSLFSDAATIIASGVGGYVGGGPTGAAVSMIDAATQTYNDKMDVDVPQRRMSRKQNVNSLAHRGSIARIGRVTQKRSKDVKVGRQFRKKVKEVVDDKSVGIFVRREKGFICESFEDNTMGANLLRIGGRIIGSLIDQVAQTRTGSNNPYHRCYWTASMFHYIDASDFPQWDGGVATDGDLSFFTPTQVWDVASKLFGSKQVNTTEETITDNISATISDTTARVSTQGMKIEVDESFVEFTIQNELQRRAYITIYHCTPKKKVLNATPLTTLLNAIAEEAGPTSGVDNAGNMKWPDNTWSTNIKINWMFQNADLEPKLIASFDSNWKYEKVDIALMPGEKICHTLKGPKNAMYDYDKFKSEGGVEQYGSIWKGLGVHTMMKVTYDEQYTNNVRSTVNQKAFINSSNAGGAGTTMSKNNKAYCPISLTTKTYYKINVPDIAGGNVLTGAANPRVTLSNRRFRSAFWQIPQEDGFPATNAGRPIIDIFDEENPQDTVTAPTTIRL